MSRFSNGALVQNCTKCATCLPPPPKEVLRLPSNLLYSSKWFVETTLVKRSLKAGELFWLVGSRKKFERFSYWLVENVLCACLLA
jgi:hypothetical protein